MEVKTIKKNMSQWKKRIYKDVFAFMKTKENGGGGGNIYKMLNVWLRNCSSILAFMKKEIKNTKRETRREMLGEQFLIVLLWTISDRKDRTFFFITFAKRFIIQLTWNTILYHWYASPAINYVKLLVLFFI